MGGCGSGKTVLSKKIVEKFHVPYLDLDRLWFESGGNSIKPNNPNEKDLVSQIRLNKVTAFIAQDSWISDGDFSVAQVETAQIADTIVFLDIPLTIRLWNHLCRTFMRRDRHPEVSFCGDLLSVRKLIVRARKLRPKIDALLAEHKDKVVILKNRRQIEKFFLTL
jgi:adenylate kinase family enzyme